ncbi:MAG: biotin carboxylase N-terminal domain-containing protein [Thermoleophilia bacterium]
MAIAALLVANRGEIAARIFRTCARLGVRTVAVVAPDDAGAYHARQADRVVAVPSYLDAAALVAAAHEAGADAIHPGYGFLSEQAAFAEAVQAAGLTWVGPPPAATRQAGDKLQARAVALAAGVPVLPSGEPDEVGFPLIVKAAGGGGGRGMRVVEGADALAEALEAARREAAAAFADDRVYCERYVPDARHVEVQLLADAHGTVLALGERDCSIQRRHQKVLEESPSPAVGPALRARLFAAATAFARAVGYVTAGTAEFLVSGEDAWFLELNARIQVEHPVTELVTGLDLVELQLRVAAGERLDPGVEPAGHAIEARLYAEHPLTLLPQAGRVESLVLPDGVRVDAGVAAGDEVPLRYDPMIAKLIAHGADRDEALARLEAALAATRVGGVTTNLPLLRWLVAHPVVRAGEATTAFLRENPPLTDPRPARGAFARPFRLNAAEAPPGPPPPSVEVALERHGGAAGAGDALVAPMPGTVIRVDVAEGDRVEARAPLVVLEAMKMELPVAAPLAGVVTRVHVAVGDRVTGGQVLVELED